ncbi:MAG TPA: LacI family transcriptional regulator, partial [Spirochaetia bacterium]|nr:LacI family transcriptional regulator [Spirochaetia bacterium]
VRIPEDIKVTGCDNIEASEYCIVPITTIDTYSQKFIDTAVMSIIKKTKNKKVRRMNCIEPDIIFRQSTE